MTTAARRPQDVTVRYVAGLTAAPKQSGDSATKKFPFHGLSSSVLMINIVDQ